MPCAFPSRPLPACERSPSKRASADIKSKAEKIIAAHATPLRLRCAMAVVGRIRSTRGRGCPETCSTCDSRYGDTTSGRSHSALLCCGGDNRCSGDITVWTRLSIEWGLAQSCTKVIFFVHDQYDKTFRYRCFACGHMPPPFRWHPVMHGMQVKYGLLLSCGLPQSTLKALHQTTGHVLYAFVHLLAQASPPAPGCRACLCKCNCCQRMQQHWRRTSTPTARECVLQRECVLPISTVSYSTERCGPCQ